VHRPCRILREKPTAAADSGSECVGSRSPHNRYASARCGRIGSGASKSGAQSGSALFVDGPRSPPAAALALLPPRRHAQLMSKPATLRKAWLATVDQLPRSPTLGELGFWRLRTKCGLPLTGISHAESAYK
jgi:hypothetical protein